MENPCDEDHDLRLQWRGKRSRHLDSDELSAAKALIMLSNSNGTASEAATNNNINIDSTTFNTNKNQEPTNLWFNKDEYSNTPLLGPHDCGNVCGKIFKSYQALGGHMSRHRPQTTAAAGTAAAVRVDRIHECPHCHKQFSTGQALGGHMRMHSDNVRVMIMKKAAKSQSISHGSTSLDNDSGGGATSHVTRGIDFDLNMPAVEELDGEE